MRYCKVNHTSLEGQKFFTLVKVNINLFLYVIKHRTIENCKRMEV
jgi:hypothetical protein